MKVLVTGATGTVGGELVKAKFSNPIVLTERAKS
jgi:FlaA1/EpsC-like NDP-sugar epimerase